MTNEFAPEKWFGDHFASARCWGDFQEEILALSVKHQRDIAAYFHGCPVPEAVAAEYAKEPGVDGDDGARRRYLMCNFWLGYIVNRALHFNDGLAMDMVTPVKRRGLSGKYEQAHVPKSYLEQMNLGSKVCGYALPRVFIKAAGIARSREEEKKEPLSVEEKRNRFNDVTEILDKAVDSREATTGDGLLAVFSEKLIEAGIVKPEQILPHVLPESLFTDQGGSYYLKQTLEVLAVKAPQLYAAYHEFSFAERCSNEIFDIDGYGSLGEILYGNIDLYKYKNGN